jgi:hypothetical protein
MHRAAAAFLLATSAWLAQFPYSNAELGFTMTLPAGFMREGEDPLAPARVVACFIAPSVEGQRRWIKLCVERRGGALPRSAQQMTFAWKGQDLPGVTFRSELSGEAIVAFATLVPLRKEPVWLVAMAPIADQGHAQSALVATLATLQGESVQQNSKERAGRAGEKLGFVVSIIFAVAAGMWIMKRRQQQ